MISFSEKIDVITNLLVQILQVCGLACLITCSIALTIFFLVMLFAAWESWMEKLGPDNPNDPSDYPL